eukprot:SAG31_NODE_86_length_26973_cov_16.850897_29_plen_83_part_00
MWLLHLRLHVLLLFVYKVHGCILTHAVLCLLHIQTTPTITQGREQFEELMRLPEDTFQSHRSQATCIRLDRSLSGLDFEASH